MVRSLSSGGIRPCSMPTANPLSGPSASSGSERLDRGEGALADGRQRGALLGQVLLVRLALLDVVADDARADDVDLVALLDLLADPLPDPVAASAAGP